MITRATMFLVMAAAATGCQKKMEEFTSTQFKFKAKFPGKPKQEERAGPANTKMTMFAVEERDGVYGVAVADLPLPDTLPQAAIDSALESSQDGAIRGGGGTFKSGSKITLAGKYPGREFVATITQPKQGQTHGRIYLVGHRLYQVLIMGTDKFATSPLADEFLNSFQLVE